MAKSKKCKDDCKKWVAAVVLVVGFLFLLADLGYWDFFGLQWWTVVFLLAGGKMVWKTWYS